MAKPIVPMHVKKYSERLEARERELHVDEFSAAVEQVLPKAVDEHPKYAPEHCPCRIVCRYCLKVGLR